MANTSSRVFNKRGGIMALDAKYTGSEPEWKDAEDITLEEYNKRFDRGLRFYGYYCDNKMMKPWIVDWMKSNGFTKDQVESIKKAPPSFIVATAGKLVRMLNQGMPNKHPDSKKGVDVKAWVKNCIEDSLYNINRVEMDPKNNFNNDEEDKPKPKPVSPLKRVENKINTDIIVPLDMLLDDIINIQVDTSPAKIPNMDIGSLLRGNKAAGNGIKYVVEWITKHLTEFREAYDKTDEELAEGYSWLRRPQLKRIVANFEKMLDDTKVYSRSKVKTRKPRVKKPKAVDKQVAKLKYATGSEDYQLSSVDPTGLPFSQRAFFFNVKNRQLSIYYASGNAGFEVKGTTLQGFDKERSIIMTLRKPLEILPLILSATPKKLDKIFEELKTKPRSANGRINANMIILRTLDIK
jgi:hypothetical protein